MKFKALILCLFAISLSTMSCAKDNNNNKPDLEKSSKLSKKTNYTQTRDQSEYFSESVEFLDFNINPQQLDFEYEEDINKPTSGYVKSDNDSNLKLNELPINIQNYLTQEHANRVVSKAEIEDNVNYEFVDAKTLNLKGTYELNLNNGVVSVVGEDIPIGTYEEVKLKMNKSTNESSELYQKYILVRGSIKGIPFEFHHRLKENIEFEYEGQRENLTIEAENKPTITFNLDLNTLISNVNFQTP